jgi:hypothetical protein
MRTVSERMTFSLITPTSMLRCKRRDAARIVTDAALPRRAAEPPRCAAALWTGAFRKRLSYG